MKKTLIWKQHFDITLYTDQQTEALKTFLSSISSETRPAFEVICEDDVSQAALLLQRVRQEFQASDAAPEPSEEENSD